MKGANVLNFLTARDTNEPFMYFVVNFKDKLISKSNFRVGKNNWQLLKKFELMLATEVRNSIPSSWYLGDAESTLENRPKIVATLVASGRVDNGNMTKSVFDGLEGLVYINDASISSSTTISTYKNGSGFSLGFVLLKSSVGYGEILMAQNYLNNIVVSNFNSHQGLTNVTHIKA